MKPDQICDECAQDLVPAIRKERYGGTVPGFTFVGTPTQLELNLTYA